MSSIAFYEVLASTRNAQERLDLEVSMKKQQQAEWKLHNGIWISTTPVLPGVWRRKEGGHYVRARALDPRTGKLRAVVKSLPEADDATAYKWLQDELRQTRAGVVKMQSPKVHFSSYAVSVLERKIEAGDLKSASTIEKWKNVLMHLVKSELGELYVDKLGTGDILRWKAQMASKVATGDYSPVTINTQFSVLRVILSHAKLEFGWASNPAEGVKPFDTSRHRTYTEEEPNALEPEELAKFLACIREMYPQHYAFTYLGFATGLRPSSIRPLRRSGKTPDVLFAKNHLLIRRSNSRETHVMESTKTGRDQRLTVPNELLAVLRWHIDTQLTYPPQIESELLFPSEIGGFRSRSCLAKPFDDVAKAIGLTKSITPRGMRRTFQDLARHVGLPDVVTRSISGHATEEMQMHYSTVAGSEQQAGLARVIQLFKPAAGGLVSGLGLAEVVLK